MRFLWAWLLVLVGAGFCPTAEACMAHYRSFESHVKEALTILEVETESVRQAPASKRHIESASDERQKGQATVRVLRTLRGKSSMQRLEVIGGPFASCAPFAQYLQFEVGQRFFLILPFELTTPDEPVVIDAVGEIFRGSPEAMDGLIENARRSWQRLFELYKKADARAYAKAEALLPKLAKPGSTRASAKVPYPVQACLDVLVQDPERRPHTRRAAGTRSIDGAPLSDPVFKPWPHKPADVVAFNHRLFYILLADRYGLEKAEISLIARTACVRKQWTSPDFCPEDVRFACENRRDLETLSLIRDLDSAEPDGMAFRVRGRSDPPEVDGALVARYLNRAPERALDSRAVLLVLQIPHPALVPFVDKVFAQAVDGFDFVDLFRFSVGIGHVEKARAALEGLRKTLSKEDDKRSQAREARSHLEDLREILRRHPCRDSVVLESIADIERLSHTD